MHVDDLLITCADEKVIDDLVKALLVRYEEGVTIHRGPVVSYLGMTFDFSTLGEVKITQEGYVIDLLGGCGVEGFAKTPAADHLFEVRDCELAGEEDAEWFHRQTAKVLYLAKRTRPDCLTAVAFLATRVTKCDVDDLLKLKRLLKYIRRTRDNGIILRPGVRGIAVRAFVDAAYGTHVDGKSVTGSCIFLGDSGPVHAKSVKQKIVVKSSTEAELVATSDSANQAFHMRRFIIAQGHDDKPVTIYQDNLSCMALIAKGKASSEKTRHMSIRYFWVKERVDQGEVVLEHLATELMVANILTKPLQGSQFETERLALTNWPATPVSA
jgi:hypothetical protein